MIFFQQQEWNDSLQELQAIFGSRLVCLGLQGSYRRGEATPTSDLDLVLILDVFSSEDLRAYRDWVRRSPMADKLCGFVSGKAELLAWPKADLFQFYHDTQPLAGTLDWLQLRIQPADAWEAVRVGAANLYHAVCHSYLFEDRASNLRELYKSPFFILQAKVYCETGEYFSSQEALLPRVSPVDRKILDICVGRKVIFSGSLSDQAIADFYDLLLTWCGGLLRWCQQEKTNT
ncbi:MAG: nucleotidyltransferase domain-containing protein [Planctomycetia bacterium]|nr:nucleotidyltransferase domain-containing protein [Planctomycetia bacterium]